MKNFSMLSDSETEIMQVIWGSDSPVTVAELLSVFENRNWKAQTMATFLSRLVTKGLLSMKKQGKANLYSAAVSEREYQRLEAKNLLDAMYDGSVHGFLSALYGGEKISGDELAELKAWFEL